jgi:ATP-dependent DNA helicase DinG
MLRNVNNEISKSPNATPPTALEKLTAKLTAVFINVLPKYGYVVRDKQIELAVEMLNALYNNGIALCEAGVGIGKTHAYILASLLISRYGANILRLRSYYPITREYRSDSPMPVIISTSSIALQKSIVTDYIPQISAILLNNRLISEPLTCVVRKGKEHYICPKRLADYLREMKNTGLKHQLLPILESNELTDLDGFDKISAQIKRKICVDSHCNHNCKQRETCPYMTFMTKAKSGEFDFQVCNHNYLLADTLRRKEDGKPLLPNYQALVIDEAHKFLQAARQMYGAEITNTEIVNLARLITDFKTSDKKTKIKIDSYNRNLDKYGKQLFKLLIKGIPPPDEFSDDLERFKTEIGRQTKTALRGLIANAENLIEQIDGFVAYEDEHYKSLRSYIVARLRNLSARLSAFNTLDDIIYWLEIPKVTKKTTGETKLCCIPKTLGQTLFADLWSKPLPIILTSGTLSASGDFTRVKKSLGLDLVQHNRLAETVKPSPFDYKKNTLLYISERVPFPDNRNTEYISAVATEVERLITAAHGHTAVLFTSYKVMELVYGIIKAKNLGYPLFKLERGGVNAIDRFKKSGNGVLFASGSMWEGIDIPGDALSMLIIVKLPFPVPDPIGDYERTLYKTMDDYKREVITPEMQLKLKQGYGRGVRTERDTVVIALLDLRVRLGGLYRKCVLTAMPDCNVTSSIADVTQFYKDHKPAEYFTKKVGGTQ